MRAIVAGCERGEVPAEVVLVVSNRPTAPGLEWARDHGLETAVLPHRDFPDRSAHDAAMVEALHARGVEWVCLAGYMRLLSRTFLEAYPGRILNIHPSLLPAFPGLEAQRQALDHGVRVSGCTVHLVDADLDHGPIVVQRSVAVAPGDTVETLSERILKQEHLAYPEALRLLLTSSWDLEGRKVVFTGSGSI